jgi:lincosamide nucleotidyltransferase
MEAMDAHELRLPERRRAVLDRFVTACWEDARVAAAFLGGSYARGNADAHSDLDLYVITTDQAYAEFFAERAAFIRSLGDPVFLEDFADYGFDLLLFILSDGTEGELALAPESGFQHIHGGPIVILVDKTGILAGVAFPQRHPAPSEQADRLRRQMYWFWHDLAHHFITPLARGRSWEAAGALEDVRRTCVDLARLEVDFTTAAEGYEQVDGAVPMERLAALAATFSPPERHTLLRAARAIVALYREMAPPLAQAHGITYPAALERLVCARLEALGGV